MTISGAEAERRRSLGVMLTGEIMYWLSLLSKKAALAFDLAFRAIRTRESVQAKEHLTVLRRDARRGVRAQGKGHLHAAFFVTRVETLTSTDTAISPNGGLAHQSHLCVARRTFGDSVI